MKLWQYQQQASGISNAQGVERTTPDKWQPRTDVPEANFRKLSAYSLAAIIPVAVFTNIFPAPSPSTAALQQSPTPIVRPVSTVHLLPATSPQDPTSMRTNQIWVDKLQTTNQFLFFPDVKRWQFLYQSFAVDPKQLTLRERITPDKWQPNTNQPLFDVKRTQWVYPSLFSNPKPLPISTFVNLWHQQDVKIQIPAKPLPHLYPSFVIDASQLAQKERITAEKWFRETERPVFDSKKQQHTYPSFFSQPRPIPNPETIRADKWHPLVAQPLFDARRYQWLYQVWTVDPKQLTQKERLTMDKWFRETQQPRFDVKRQQWLYPPFTIDPLELIPHWNLVNRTTDANWDGVSRSTDDSYNQVSRSSDDSYNQVSRSSDDSYNPVNRASDDDWHLTHREP